MKTLEKLSITEKATLFHKLFIKDIPDLLNCIEGIAKAITEASPEEAQAWDDGMFASNYSYTLVVQAAEIFKQYKKKMHNHSRLFADQLFDGYQALFTVYCLRRCSTAKELDNQKLEQAVELFFT